MFLTELSFVLSVSLIVSVTGHGRLIDPASRNAAWRYGFDNPPHYTDNELNCGGFNVQWSTNKGKCGVCGDPYHKKEQPHVYPGKYANNRIITKTYREGQEIDVVVELTSNHQGFFVFRVGQDWQSSHYTRKAEVCSEATERARKVEDNLPWK